MPLPEEKATVFTCLNQNLFSLLPFKILCIDYLQFINIKDHFLQCCAHSVFDPGLWKTSQIISIVIKAMIHQNTKNFQTSCIQKCETTDTQISSELLTQEEDVIALPCSVLGGKTGKLLYYIITFSCLSEPWVSGSFRNFYSVIAKVFRHMKRDAVSLLTPAQTNTTTKIPVSSSATFSFQRAAR